MNLQQKDKSQLLSILAYVWVVGWIISYLINQSNRNYMVSFHLRQAIGVHLIFALGYIPNLGFVMHFLAIFLAIMGVVNALKRRAKPLPIVGGLFEDWFKNL